mgnify:CR=1 FL=1
MLVTIKTATSPHECYWCCDPIEVGQTYYHNVQDDVPYNSHVECGHFAEDHLDDDERDSDEFCWKVDQIAREKGIDSELNTYDLVKLIGGPKEDE